MRRLNPTLIYWLQVWGTCQQHKTGLEYPSITAEARLLHSPGRSTRQNHDPSYEPDEIDVLVDGAVRSLTDRAHAQLLVCRFIEGKSDLDIMRDAPFKSEGAARWQVELAMREVALLLKFQPYV